MFEMARINRVKEVRIYNKTQINFDDDQTVQQIRAANQRALQILNDRISHYYLIKKIFWCIWNRVKA